MKKLLIISACVMGMGANQIANAVSYTFSNITANNVLDAAAGVAQLSVDVTDASDSSQQRVAFRFSNSGPIAMSITDLYWADGTLLKIGSITESGGGVSFSPDAKPVDLPSGNTANPKFETTAGFSADSDAPVMANGVNPGEWVTVTFDLLVGKTFADTINALNYPNFDKGQDDLRIGIHVQGFSSGGSESFINKPGNSVPDGGATVLLLGIGMMGLGIMARRKV